MKKAAVAFVVLLFIAIVLAYSLVGLRTEYQEKHRIKSFRSVGLAVLNYEATHKKFPPCGTNHSWRIRTLHFLSNSPIVGHYNYEEAWDTDNNREIATRPIRGRGTEVNIEGYPREFCTDSLGRTPFLFFCGHGAIGTAEGRSSAELPSDRSSIVFLGESELAPVFWLEPKDFEFRSNAILEQEGCVVPALTSNHPFGPLVMFADGVVCRVSKKIPQKILKAMISVDVAERISREELVDEGWLQVK